MTYRVEAWRVRSVCVLKNDECGALRGVLERSGVLGRGQAALGLVGVQ